MERDLDVTRLTAMRYLDELSAGGILRKLKVGRSKFYINVVSYDILTGEAPPAGRATA